MTQPVVVYTNLFTIAGKDVKINRYIDMYYIWLNNIIKYGGLTYQDFCITFIDGETKKYIEQSPILQMFQQAIPNFHLIEYEQPTNIKQGMFKRYEIQNILNLTNSIEFHYPFYIYLDIDVLVVKNIRNLFSNNTSKHKTTIFLRPEECMLENNYYGELILEEEKELLHRKNLENMPGFTSGIYGWANSKDTTEFFEFICKKGNESTKELYTVDQPFFNAAIFHYLFVKPGIFNFILLESSLVGHNTIGSHFMTENVLINFCGIPGDDKFHWDKLLLQLFIQGS